MREIKYRGKAVMTKVELDYHDIPNYQGWIKGSLIVDENDNFIVGNIVESSDDGLIHEWWAKVQPESVGQYTGLKDKNGKDIYEGDIIYHHHREKEYRLQGIVRYEVKWAGFYFAENRGMNTNTSYEVIGNIYENPELLEVKK